MRIPSLATIGGALRPRLAGWRHVPRLLASLWRVAPSLTLWIGLLRLLRALQPPAMLFVGKLIVDEILLQSRTSAPGWSLGDWFESGRMTPLLFLIALEFALVAGGNTVNRISTLLESVLFERHSHRLAIALVEHAADLDLKDVESSAAQNRLQRTELNHQRPPLCTPLLSFAKFEAAIAEFDRNLRVGGLLLLQHTNFRFLDTAVSTHYAPAGELPAHRPEAAKYGRDDRLIPQARAETLLYRKLAEAD